MVEAYQLHDHHFCSEGPRVMKLHSPSASSAAQSLFSSTLADFAACRQPWNAYVQMLTKFDSEPYPTRLYDKPMYRGRKKGREGWLFGQQVQLHYRYYPDEHAFVNIGRWRRGETIGDVALQQFRGAQPPPIDDGDPQGFKRPPPETYMKLNYKNPATYSAFLTQTGHMYPMDILPMHPEAVLRVRNARVTGIRLGLYPRFGNPFWHRSQKYRPKPDGDSYDPVTSSSRKAMEHFAFNWLQTQRIQQYFAALEGSAPQRQGSSKSAESTQQDAYFTSYPAWAPFENSEVSHSPKTSTVPGLMSTSGMKKKFHTLYASSGSRKRMGFTNPVFGIKKI